TLHKVLDGCTGGWPPDMPAVFAEVRRRLDEQKAVQRPRFHSVGWDGDVTDTGLPDPGPNVSEEDVEPLAEVMAGRPGLADRAGRASLVRELSGGMAFGLNVDDPAFAARLARNVLATPAELGELFEVLARDGFGLGGSDAEARFFRRLGDILTSA